MDAATLSVAAALREESTLTDGDRHDSLQRSAPNEQSTIEEALRSLIDECSRDKFWKNLAKPAEMAIEQLRTMEKASTDESTAKTARDDAVRGLPLPSLLFDLC